MYRLAMFAFFVLASAWLNVGPAAADDRSVCFQVGSLPDAAINACGRMISSGRLNAAELVKVYASRGTTFLKKAEYDTQLQISAR